MSHSKTLQLKILHAAALTSCFIQVNVYQKENPADLVHLQTKDSKDSNVLFV